MSTQESVIVAAFILYSLFLLAILIEYITDKRAKRAQAPGEAQEIPPSPGQEKEPGQPAEKGEAPEQWKHEEFE